MIVDELLGCRVTLVIRGLTAAGALLGDQQPATVDEDTLLVPARELPPGARVGDELAVFVGLDSNDRPIATTAVPHVAVGEVTFLEITDVTDIGAFVDNGVGKELLVPFAQQSRPLRVGERETIGMYVDKSRRLAGTTFVGPMLAQPGRRFPLDAWVTGEAWRNDPEVGLFVIVERAFIGLVPASEPHALRRGESARFRVAHGLPDGKIVLSLRDHAHKELEADAARVLARLLGPTPPRVGDRSDPDELRAAVGLSKKAFKRAVGRLLKDRAVEIDAGGHVVPLRR
jgi:predicted RNA-binding protein (virulence factor B family)